MGKRIGLVGVALTAFACLVLYGPAAAQSARTDSGGGAARVSTSSLPPRAPQSRFDGHLGVMFSTQLDGQGRAVTRVDGDGLTVVKTATAFGDTEIAIAFKKDRVVVALGPDGIRVERGRARASLNPRSLTEADLARVERVLRGSQAVRAFKQLTAQIEFGEGPDDGFTLGALVDGAVVRILDGEVGVVHRLGNRLKARRHVRVREASLVAGAPQFEDCLQEYELTVDGYWDVFMSCVADAGDASWYLRSALAAACELEWAIRAETAAFQFAACAALPI